MYSIISFPSSSKDENWLISNKNFRYLILDFDKHPSHNDHRQL
jgi:hypothetical protein